MQHPVETYLHALCEVRRSGAGTSETSYYGPLSDLLSTIGHSLKPKVRCIVQLANQGSGHPDLGLFTADQIERGATSAPLPGQKPSRGVIEAKATSADVHITARSPQVAKYLTAYGSVLVTNFREFLLVGRDRATGAATALEHFALAPDEAAFWSEAAHPRRAAKSWGDRLLDFLRRALLHAAPLHLPEDVAWFLASYAREALARVEAAALPALDAVRAALEGSLGLRFADDRGERFFRSTLVQTLFYGVFSSWILWSKERPSGSPARFDWRGAAWTLRVPMISQLFEQVATPSRLEPLGLVEVLDWAAAALDRVDRAAFFGRFQEDHAVQYFYEPFLRAFDPALRKELGVWYTPPEVVRYMVARVDQALRRDLGIPDGLADPRVHVLDPCCGTGAYLVEVLDRIASTLREKGSGNLLDMAEVREAARHRLHGFELLPAPFVVAHLQLGLVLQRLKVPLADGDRPAIYLTNALTGWQPPTEDAKKRLAQLELPLPGLREEREAAEAVKRDAPILVILGNPPYNGFAGVAVDEERDLSTAYRTPKKVPRPQGQGLNDLFVRFFRMAERKIVEHTGRGIVCFISNYAWLDGLSYSAMRERYLEVFDRVTIDCLNGDKYKTGKLTPDGQPDPSVFSTEWNREGIQVGTAITLLLKSSAPDHSPPGSPGQPPTTGVGQPPPAATLPPARPLPGVFRRRLPHFEGRGNPLFITFRTAAGLQLPPAARDITLRHLLHDHPHKLSLLCAVVMPDHVHLIYWPREDAQQRRYSKGEVVGAMKSVSARHINRLLGRSGAVWQEESFDHVVRRGESLEAKVEYLCLNPVRAGLAATPEEYPWVWRAWVEGDAGDEGAEAAEGGCSTPTPAAGKLLFRHFWGKTKARDLLAALHADEGYDVVEPPLELGLPYFPTVVSAGYQAWPEVPDLFPVNAPGIITARDELLVAIDRADLEVRLVAYFNEKVSDEEMSTLVPAAMKETKRFSARSTRRALQRRGMQPGRIVRYAYRPFDIRWFYWEPETKLVEEKRAEVRDHFTPDNVWLVSGQRQRRGFHPPMIARTPSSFHLIENTSNLFPLWLVAEGASEDLFSSSTPSSRRANLTSGAQSYLKEVGADPETLFYHVLALQHAPTYGRQNDAALRQDWPRVPLPASKEALVASARLGREVAALLDPEADVPGVTSGKLRPDLRPFGVFTLPPGHALDEARDFAVTARWGFAGRGGITMPARGDLRERPQGGVPAELQALLGAASHDVHLNPTACWANVPERVWDYTLGGYQVIKKWLSYREQELLGRPLRREEVRHVEQMVRRIAALLLLGPALDASYAAVKTAAHPWGGTR